MSIRDSQGRAEALTDADGGLTAIAERGIRVEGLSSGDPVSYTHLDGGVAGPFYFAEDYHQQYLEKNPSGYCLHGPTGLTLPTPGDTAAADASPV